ncbi:MAG: hypothetical protein E7611_01355 [Ruminococcaceae bacterium]|nr:hypothetical protein [Oscillospiraceae bacterium]
MGFGLLLVGYITAFIITLGLGNYLFAGMLIGGFLMFLGLCELRKYCPTFLYALIANVFLILCSFYETAAWFDGILLLNSPIASTFVLRVFDWIEIAINLIFNITLLYGIADLSRRVEYPETREKAYRNMIFVGVFNVFQILMLIPNTIFDRDKGFFMTLLLIVQIIYAVFNAFLIFKCYAMICPEGEEDMKRKPSRFEFVNKMREKQDEREQRAIESTKEYFEKKLEKRNQKLNNQGQKRTHNHKKKK